MAVADTLITRYVLTDQYSDKAKRIERATKQIASSMDDAGKRASGLGSVLSSLGRGALGALQGMATAVGAGAVGILGLAGVAVKASADMDSLKRALTAVAGSSEEAERQLARLKEVAKAPGLGLKEAIQGSIRLQAAGFSAQLAERALKAFGNAVAASAGGKEELDGVTVALAQIASKGKISAEEIMQLAERIPQIRKAMQAAFGTSDTEALQEMGIGAEEFVGKIVTELEKIPPVTGGAKNALENLGDAMFQAFAQAGDVINRYLVPAIETVGNWLVWMVNSGIIGRIVEGFADLFGLGSKLGDEPLIKALAFVTAFTEELPNLMREAGNYIVKVFNHVGKMIADTFKFAFALFVGGQVFVWLRTLITLYKEWRAAVAGVAIAQAILDALTGVGWVAIVGAAAAGIATYVALGKLFESLDKGFGDIPNAPSLAPVFKKASEYEEQFKRSTGSPTSNLGGAESAPSTSTADRKPASALQAIAKATQETAKNTREQVDLQRYALGGGDLGKLGVDPISIRKMRKGGGAIDVNVTGADESINRLLSELLRAILPTVVRQARI